MVGIVVVSHNRRLAQEIINFSNQMKFHDFNIINGGGIETEEYGTSPIVIKHAIEEANQGEGVLVFIDLGSAIMSTELAIELLDGELEVLIADAPIVEGVFSTVSGNSPGTSLKELKKIAEESRGYKKLQ